MIKKDNRKSNFQDIKNQLKSIDTELKDGVFIFANTMSINEFATKIKKSPNEVINYYFKKGKLYNINYILDEEKIAELCMEFGYDFSKKDEITVSNFMETVEIIDNIKDLKSRPPIITIMGHVDHGKTTLLDYIRKSHVVNSEAGGITQHIGAYQIMHEKQKITFLDTPGHEAFTAMRARGAKVTDIVVLVVAADDGVMPQTKEAIDHAKAANVPIIVFVNKVDKHNIDLERIKGELAQEDIVSEEWSGDIQFVYGSGLTGQGVEKLLNAIIVQADMLELKANPNRFAIGTVIESRIDKGQGTVATLIVQNGTLLKGDFIVAGYNYGHIRSMLNSNNEQINVALPGTPVVISGLNYSPEAGDRFFAFHEEKLAKDLADKKQQEDRIKQLRERTPIEVKEGIKLLNIIIKSDVQGTAEAIKHALLRIENEEAKVNIVRASVGTITKSDVLLAQASNAIIISFNIRPSNDIKQFADHEKVTIRSYTIIYKIIEEVQSFLKGMMKPKYEEKIIGQAQVLKVIYSSKIGNIAGSKVISGTIKAFSKVRIIRENKILITTKLDSLQRGKDSVKNVNVGFEFGTHIKNYNDIREGDTIEAFEDVVI